MNSSYQFFLAILLVILAVTYLVWLAKKTSSTKGCGGGCDCHQKKPTLSDKNKS
jgi:hypothetical protein